VRLKHFIYAIVGLLAILAGPAEAQAPARHALLIGNQAYTGEIGALTNPHNDVALMETALKTLGFTVTVVRDARLGATNIAINRYLRTLAAAGPGAVGFFYYSGHGAADGTTNYLIPVDATSTDTAELWDQSLRLGEITRRLKVEAGNATHFVVFDACRNSLKLREPGKRTIVQAKGFRAERQEVGMLISYATAEGELASDVGQGAGPYAKVLAEEIVMPGVEAVTMFRNVQRRVRAAIRQEPYLGFNALGDVYFAGKSATQRPKQETQSPLPPRLSEAREAWDLIQETGDAAVLEAFIRRFGDTFYGDLAKARLAALKDEKQRVALLQRQEEDRARAAVAAAEKAAADQRRAEEEARRRDPVASLAPGSGRSARDCPTCPEMVVVPAGSFMMGSPENEAGRENDEGPQRRVTIAKPFAVGKFEVTSDEWDACVTAGGCTYSPEASWGRGRQPVIGVSWDDAKHYVAWLSRTTGQGYRLLSEAEWEYAARAGTTTPFSTGATITTRQANFHGNYTYGGSAKGEYRERTVEVGSFPANPFGLHDMHGNVSEWVEDCGIGNYQGAPADGSARTSGECTHHLLRGGSWSGGPSTLRSADRLRALSSVRNYHLGFGFRVARVISR